MDKIEDIFNYTYSATRQEEIRRIRNKYLHEEKEEDKMEQLRRLRHDLRQYLILAEHSPLPGEGEAPELGAGCPPPAAGRESVAA